MLPKILFTKGNILEDEELIGTLAASTKMSEDISALDEVAGIVDSTQCAFMYVRLQLKCCMKLKCRGVNLKAEIAEKEVDSKHLSYTPAAILSSCAKSLLPSENSDDHS